MGWLEAIGSMALIPAISSRVLARCITESYIGEATDAASDDSASAEAGHAGANTPMGASSLGPTVVPPTLGVESGRMVVTTGHSSPFDVAAFGDDFFGAFDEGRALSRLSGLSSQVSGEVISSSQSSSCTSVLSIMKSRKE